MTHGTREEVKWLDPDYARQSGIVQEVNRQFLNPLGLGLAVGYCSHKADERVGLLAHKAKDCPYPNSTWAGIIDWRDEPEGVFFEVDDSSDDVQLHASDYLDKIESVKKLQTERQMARLVWAKEHGIILDGDTMAQIIFKPVSNA